MKHNNKIITLSGRHYPLQDIGEGFPCLLLIHQHCQLAASLSMIIDQLRDNYRLLIVDVTEHLPAATNHISDQQLNQIIDDLHLLCDIYWLKKVMVHSDYQPDLLQSTFKERLFERYQSSQSLFNSPCFVAA